MMEAIKGVLYAVLIVAILAVTVLFTIAVGYFFGMVLAIIPFISEWLTAGLPESWGVTSTDIPTFTAWLAVVTLFIGGGSRVNTKGAE